LKKAKSFKIDIIHKNETPIVGWSINRRAKIKNFMKKIEMKEYVLLEVHKMTIFSLFF